MSIITKVIGDKKRYRAYKARLDALPTPYRETVEALVRYLTFFGPGDGADYTVMLEDLVELFERTAADGVDVRSVVGDDPVEFAEDFQRNYPAGQWIARERDRLTKAVDNAAADDEAGESR